MTNRVIACLEIMRLESGRKPWLYSNLNFLDNVLNEPARIATLIEGIWLAWPAPTANAPRMPKNYPSELVKLWQRSWWVKIDGCDGVTDENVWLGTQAEWEKLTVMPPIPPPPTDVLEPRVAILEQQVAKLYEWGTSLEE